VIPIAWGLLDASGRELTSGMHVLTQESETLTFPGYAASRCPRCCAASARRWCWSTTTPTPSCWRCWRTTPIPFNRWEAAQRLATRALRCLHPRRCTGRCAGRALHRGDAQLLRHPVLDAAFKELVLTLPAETYIAEQLDVVDPQRVHAVRESMREQLATALQADWEWAYEAHRENGAYSPDPVSSGRRALAGLALTHLCIAARCPATRCGRARPTSASRTRPT
jgi:aminopeptidase N